MLSKNLNRVKIESQFCVFLFSSTFTQPTFVYNLQIFSSLTSSPHQKNMILVVDHMTNLILIGNFQQINKINILSRTSWIEDINKKSTFDFACSFDDRWCGTRWVMWLFIDNEF